MTHELCITCMLFTKADCITFLSVDGKLISKISKGICVLVGISEHDNAKDVEYM